MNTLSIADQAKVSALESGAMQEAHPGADDQAKKARAAKDRKNEAARNKRAGKAKAEHPASGTVEKTEAPAAVAVPKAPRAKTAPRKPKAAPAQVHRSAPTTGGARDGAGRKPLYKEAMSKAVTVKLTERQFKAFHGVPEGGTAWLRRGLDELIAATRRK